MRKLIPLFSLVFITACANELYPVSSPYFRIPEGSQLYLRQTLTIAPENGRVTLQNGKIVTGSKLDHYYPHCWFVSWVISPTETVIVPDQFIVTASMKYERHVVRQTPLRFAGADYSYRTVMDAGPVAIEYFTELMIHSDKQPNLRQFICSHWEDPSDAKHLTVAEINRTLGDIAELKPLVK